MAINQAVNGFEWKNMVKNDNSGFSKKTLRNQAAKDSSGMLLRRAGLRFFFIVLCFLKIFHTSGIKSEYFAVSS